MIRVLEAPAWRRPIHTDFRAPENPLTLWERVKKIKERRRITKKRWSEAHVFRVFPVPLPANTLFIRASEAPILKPFIYTGLRGYPFAHPITTKYPNPP